MDKPFKVLKIEERARQSDTGGVERYYHHQIRTKGGTVLQVDIDAADFTPEKAGPILEKAAANADAILKL